MAEIYPSELQVRKTPNLRLGIKSSLNSYRQTIASLYMIYRSCDRVAEIEYTEEENREGKTVIKLKSDIRQQIVDNFSVGANELVKIEESPLFNSQIEALQVGLSLFLHICSISLTNSGKQERTGQSRYNKTVSFSDKMCLLDDMIQSLGDQNAVNTFVVKWLDGKEYIRDFDDRLKKLLTSFTTECCFKLRIDDGSERLFNIESLYKELVDGNTIILKDNKEFAGPTRILNAFVDEGMLWRVQKNRNILSIDGEIDDALKNFINQISVTLDLTIREYPIQHVPNWENGSVTKSCNSIYQAYLAAIRTKPFLLLAGISGTGKSRIVRKLAQATTTAMIEGLTQEELDAKRWTLHRPTNFELVQVKPNWHNSMDVVGYLSNIPTPHYVFTPFVEFVVKAWQHTDVPFFLCLDEMNLAPVEEYFAEYLSAIESRSKEGGEYTTDPIIKPFNDYGKEAANQMVNELFPDFKAEDATSPLATTIKNLKGIGLTLPPNLIVVGTVNMDETTFSFSRKVLDRAMSIEMNEVDYDNFLAGTTDDDIKALANEYGEAALGQLLVDRHIEAREIADSADEDARFVVDYLKRINCLLDGTPFKLGYRAANEAIIYLKAAQDFGIDDRGAALDSFTLMKVLSRIEGDETKLKITDSATDKQRLANAGLTFDNAKIDGNLNVLTALRQIVCQTLGEYIEAESKPEDVDANGVIDEAEGIQSNDNGNTVIERQKLKTIAKIDSMISQLMREHFVSYWN